jgi:hypothetical protein
MQPFETDCFSLIMLDVLEATRKQEAPRGDHPREPQGKEANLGSLYDA